MSSVKWNLRFFAVVENDMTLCLNERDVQFKLYVHLFGRIRRHSVFSSFNNLLSIFYITNACFLRRNRPMNMLGKNKRFDLNVISKQVNAQRMSFD